MFPYLSLFAVSDRLAARADRRSRQPGRAPGAAPYAADTVLSRVAGERPAPIAVGLPAQCVSLGRRAGIYQLAHRNDQAIGLYLAGRTGARIKEFVCSGVVRTLAKEARRPGSLSFPAWLQDGKRRRSLLAARDELPTAGERAV